MKFQILKQISKRSLVCPFGGLWDSSVPIYDIQLCVHHDIYYFVTSELFKIVSILYTLV